MMPAIHSDTVNHICIDVGGSEQEASPLALTCVEILRSRGIEVSVLALATPLAQPTASGCILSGPLSPSKTREVGDSIAQIAQDGMPTVLYLPPFVGKASGQDRHAACVALLRSRGAVVTSDPEVWVECAILLSAYGSPTGPQIAIVAPPSSWLSAAALGQAQRANRQGQRFSPLFYDHDSPALTDIVLTDVELFRSSSETSHSQLVLPVSGKAERIHDKPVLVGLANALRAAELCGHAAARISSGIGPASSPPVPPLSPDIDRARYTSQESKLRDAASDHECKVLLSSYGVSITRQAVATTPSAATRIAKKAGYPVEMKGWGANQPTEADGAMVISGIATASEVRRAFASVCAECDCDAVIIRATPMSGRELRFAVRSMGALGLVAFLYQPGRSSPAAALAPLRPIDALAMSKQVVASRDGDDDPDWQSLSELLIRASHLVSDNPRVRSLELSRVVVGRSGEGALVIDARAELQS
ncbi:MAG: acetate--CoA ligase family protein [Kofleriaceae bacterium]|nr:acetate--CoA ligase family protein [Kofleriaceae bacterium]